MEIDIPAGFLADVDLISKQSGEPPEDVVNSAIRFFIMIHHMPFNDQLELKRIISKTFSDIQLTGFH